MIFHWHFLCWCCCWRCLCGWLWPTNVGVDAVGENFAWLETCVLFWACPSRLFRSRCLTIRPVRHLLFYVRTRAVNHQHELGYVSPTRPVPSSFPPRPLSSAGIFACFSARSVYHTGLSLGCTCASIAPLHGLPFFGTRLDWSAAGAWESSPDGSEPSGRIRCLLATRLCVGGLDNAVSNFWVCCLRACV